MQSMTFTLLERWIKNVTDNSLKICELDMIIGNSKESTVDYELRYCYQIINIKKVRIEME